MRGWFDAFRNDGGPTLYSYSNRTPVTGDVPTISLYVLFFTLFIAFVIIFPGVRKERFTTFTVTTLSLFVGSAILVSKYGSAWHVADTSIMSYYRAFSREKLAADIGVHIGLMHFNVTLQDIYLSGTVLSSLNLNDSLVNTGLLEDIDYNERFHWESATEIQEEFREALIKGLPYPILTVVEYFSMDEEGFCWGRSYRQAGYYASILLWASFASWCLMNLLLVVVPRYGAYQMIVTGALMITTNVLYYLLIPSTRLMIRFEDNFLMFKFGWCYWLCFSAGILCVAFGAVISIVDLMYPHKFSTILEVDYGTPFDRHIIIEESHYTKRNKRGSGKRSLEDPEPMGLGRKILRTLSMRGDKSDDLRLPHGVLNSGFEMDPPKSPWRYPHHMMNRPDGTPLRPALHNAFAKNPALVDRALVRLAAPTPTKSPKSVSFRRQSRLTETFQVDPMRLRRSESNDSAGSGSTSSSGIGVDHHKEPQKFQTQTRPVDIKRTDSASSISSFGLGLLSRTHSRHEVLNNPHIAISPQLSGQKIQIDSSHLPLSRITYKQNKQTIGLLPRASLERKNSDAEEDLQNSPPSANNRRDSNNSDKSRSASSGFSSTGFDIRQQKRPGPDGHEMEDRRGSNESSGSSNHIPSLKMALREPDW
ncbi:uncharacterized protein LOC110846211 isoform X2 [Folsomia candida]|uniref:uncharacterized protein LOC110846211 isoform X2 n=1 Tax=Folsomia candida TaxID=158441 RepID=UPI000B8EF721|nr:uncharacterized protein LOC110846211 isoform X2 [Folsomia candida]